VGFDGAHAGHAFNSPNGTGRVRPQADLRLTECKFCEEGVFQSEPRIWASLVLPSRASGLVHCRCADEHPDSVRTAGEPTIGGQRKYRT
jgi:hypothetical protein